MLVVDLVVSSLSVNRVGFIDDLNVLPCVGNDAYSAAPPGQLALPLEVYESSFRGSSILQQRSPIIKTCDIRTKFKQKRLTSITIKTRKASYLWSVRSVLSSKEPIVNCNGATESSGILLQWLKQKLEEQIYKDPQLTQVAEFGLHSVNLEYDLHAALLILEKEEDLQEYNELSHAMVEFFFTQ
ncbi:unnamed protein product [Cuscuta europaea]|uniref:Uncharacterized protein n=1 Tax=Cuscuta europaea TaxID=41803 RepID=A0A9P1EG10_CUSEU|nr:unnamed protein product [Cuscuta europaea]